MRNRPRPQRAHLIATGAAALALGAAAVSAGAPADADVTVSISGLRSDKGLVRACMTASPASFPGCREDPNAYKGSVSVGAHGASLHFTDVRPGRYAIALLHDENANGKPDFTLGMMPREGFGFSRDAKLRMGPPRFADAALEVPAGHTSLSIKMRYML